MADPDGRFRLIDAPLLSPGVDYISRAAHGPVVDTGVDIRLNPIVVLDPKSTDPRPAINQRLYLHPDTIRELAQVAGVLEHAPEGGVLRELEAYNRGYADAVKERVGDQLLELAGRLGDLAAVWRADDDSGVDAAAGDEDAGGDADDVPGDADAKPRYGRPARSAGSSV